MTKVKICGITNLEDALVSAQFGADAIGFNFYQKSPRYITPGSARSILAKLPNGIKTVGVFVNESIDTVIRIAQETKMDAVQLHGDETPDYATQLYEWTGLQVIKAFRVSPKFKPEDVLQYKVDAVLLDAYSRHKHGGTGQTFDWEIAKSVQQIFPKMYLAGGISAENIGEAILVVNPFAVDVCSGVERQRGLKDSSKLESLFVCAKVQSYAFRRENREHWPS